MVSKNLIGDISILVFYPFIKKRNLEINFVKFIVVIIIKTNCMKSARNLIFLKKTQSAITIIVDLLSFFKPTRFYYQRKLNVAFVSKTIQLSIQV